MKVEVSIGEAVDKLSILELKLKKIPDPDKRIEIQKEVDALSECIPYKNNRFFYNLLCHVNETIWDMTDLVKTMSVTDPNYASLSYTIFEFNQKRFRIKQWYNMTCDSTVKEQKGYAKTQCTVIIHDISLFYAKLHVLHYLSLEYDTVTILSNFKDKISTILTIPTVCYSGDETIPSIDLKEYEIENARLFELPPVFYLSGGLLGDFVHQLSVIQETFLKTGRKGVLYISNIGDPFRFGLEKTYQDTYKLITSQDYIYDYKIHNGEVYDVNLSEWRNRELIRLDQLFSNTYQIEWGLHAWINVPIDPVWKDTVLITTNSYRPASNIDFSKLCAHPRVRYINLNEAETLLFQTTYNPTNMYTPSDLYEMCVAIKSCQLFIGNFSSPLAFAYAMHKTCVVGMNVNDRFMHVGLETIFPHITICPDTHETMQIIQRKMESMDIETVKKELYDNYRKDIVCMDRDILEQLKQERFMITNQLEGYTYDQRLKIMQDAFELSRNQDNL